MCVHWWLLAPRAVDDQFSARCRRCGAARSFPAYPPRLNARSPWAGGAATKAIREARREALERVREAAGA